MYEVTELGIDRLGLLINLSAIAMRALPCSARLSARRPQKPSGLLTLNLHGSARLPESTTDSTPPNGMLAL